MKKLMVALCAVVLGVSVARAEFFWSTWNRGDIADKEVSGCVLGFSSHVKEMMAGVQADFLVSTAEKVRNGAQLGLYNSADSAALQFGLLCFNKTGFIPFCVFFNMDKRMFGAEK